MSKINYANISKLSKEIDAKKEKIEKNYLPLIDKYRPKKFKNIILNDVIKSKISAIIDMKIMPNMIIVGPPGTGKTSLVTMIARNMLSKLNSNSNDDRYSEGILSLNASDNRGLDILNNTIIYFCKKKLIDANGNPIPKIIIMDEADNITTKAQNMIANMIEEFSKHTRFAFTCNESSKLIESIQSRCLVVYIAPLKPMIVSNHLEKICQDEKIEFDKEGLDMIAKDCKGDLRASINLLDAISNGFGYINCENIVKLSYQPNPTKILNLIQECAQRSIYNAIDIIHVLKSEGYCGTDILLAMINVLKEVAIDESIRLKYIHIISEYYTKVSDGLDTNLQLYSCISKMILVE
jgi:replication factor C subunit 2/4